MAITGTGTKNDPFLVGTYEEMRSVCSLQANSGKYVALSKDINCEFYGESWEWEGFDVWTNIDLNGHEISNVLIANNSHLFFLQYYGGNKIYIENGRMISIFNNQAKTIIRSDYEGINIAFKNIQFSVEISGLQSYAFQNCCFLNCSFFINAKTLLAPIFYISSSNVICDSNATFENCDIWFNIENINQMRICEIIFDSYSINHIFDLCRFRGTIKSGTRNTYTLLPSGFMVSSIWNVDCLNTEKGSYSDDLDRLSYGLSSGLINEDLCPLYSTNGESKVDSQQLKNADYLESIEFPIINIKEESGDISG